MFSPWRYSVDRTARALLEAAGWQEPPDEALPTGNDLVDRYVAPLGRHPAIAPHVRVNARVVAIGRKDFDKVRTKGRDQQPFEIHLESGEVVEARAVIDASGTWPARTRWVPAAWPCPASVSTPIGSCTASLMWPVQHATVTRESASWWSAAAIPPSTSSSIY